MARFGESARCFRVQFVFQKQQLFVKMRDGRIQRASVLAAVGKRAGDPDRADRVQSVRVLYDLAFKRLRASAAVLTEGHGVDRLADTLDLLRRDFLCVQERARVGVTFRLKQLVVIGVVPAEIAAKQVLYVGDGCVVHPFTPTALSSKYQNSRCAIISRLVKASIRPSIIRLSKAKQIASFTLQLFWCIPLLTIMFHIVCRAEIGRNLGIIVDLFSLKPRQHIQHSHYSA